METPAAAGLVVNIGSDQPVEILQLAQRVINAVDPGLSVRFQSYADAYDADFEDVRRRVPDLSRLRNLIGHSPTHNLDSVIREVVEFQRRTDGVP